VFLDRRGRPWTKQTIKDSLSSAKKRAGLAAVPYRFHDARHAYGTQLAEANLELPVIAALLGHKDLKSSQRYLHPRLHVAVAQARAKLEPEPAAPAAVADGDPSRRAP
jgi:site-specific recombinase XerD